MAEKQLAGLDRFTSALLPAARCNPKPFPCQQLFLLAVLVSMPRKYRFLSFSFQQWTNLVRNNHWQFIRLSGVGRFPSPFFFSPLTGQSLNIMNCLEVVLSFWNVAELKCTYWTYLLDWGGFFFFFFFCFVLCLMFWIRSNQDQIFNMCYWGWLCQNRNLWHNSTEQFEVWQSMQVQPVWVLVKTPHNLHLSFLSFIY